MNSPIIKPVPVIIVQAYNVSSSYISHDERDDVSYQTCYSSQIIIHLRNKGTRGAHTSDKRKLRKKNVPCWIVAWTILRESSDTSLDRARGVAALAMVNSTVKLKMFSFRIFVIQLQITSDFRQLHDVKEPCTVTTTNGSTENAGRENDGPSKSRGMKMQDMKMTDQVAGHENDGPSKSQGVKMHDMKM